jgi:precorrin-6B methylase 1
MLDNNGIIIAKANIIPIISAFESLCSRSNISISNEEYNALLQKVTETLTNWGVTITT